MSNIYEILRPKKGYAYTDEQIVDYSLISIPIPTNKKNKQVFFINFSFNSQFKE